MKDQTALCNRLEALGKGFVESNAVEDILFKLRVGYSRQKADYICERACLLGWKVNKVNI